jgi:integrase
MPPRSKPPHLVKHYQMWFARINVPIDCQHVLGQKQFIRSTGERSPERAYAKAAPWIAEWKTRIQEARIAAKDPLRADIERLTNDYRVHRGKGLDDAGAAVALDAIEFLFERLGGLSRAETLARLATSRGDVAAALSTIPGAPQTYEVIIGRATPILAYLDRWKAAAHRRGKTLDQMISDVRQFAAACSEPLEAISERHVTKWVEGRLRTSTAKTVRRKLTALRQYWLYLQGHEIVSRDRKPFTAIAVKDHRTEVERTETERVRFEPHDLVRVWEKARDDPMLFAAIRIAAFTGARREGICKLKTGSIQRDPATGVEFLHFAEKSKNGVRDVPVHREIRELIAALREGADGVGFLIHSSDDNKYGSRGDAIGKRFTRLKQEMGFDRRHVFHSIRHTVIHLFRRAGCPVELRNQIVGHADDHVGAGYGGDIGLDQKKEWLERAILYPSR